MFRNIKGCLFLMVDRKMVEPYLTTIPESWQKKQQERDDKEYHITILTPKDKKSNSDILPEDSDFTIVGLKKTDQVAFLVIHCPAGDKFRKQLDLPEHNFHITLGFAQTDIHTIDKSVNCLEKNEFVSNDFYKKKTIITKQLYNLLILYRHFPEDLEILKEYINCLIMSKQYEDALNFSYNLALLDPTSGVYSIIKLREKSGNLDKISSEMWKYLDNKKISNQKFGDFIIETLNKYDDSDSYYYCQNNFYKKIRKPRNFTQVHPFIFGSAIFKESCLEFLKMIDIRAVFNLMEKKEGELSHEVTKFFGRKYYQFEIQDRSVTTMEHMEQILDRMEEEINNENKIVVHCMGGKGRTNMVIACYLMREGQRLDNIFENLKNTRDVIFSKDQEIFMRQFEQKILENPKKNPKCIVYNHRKCPKMLVLVGLPASGKSTLSNHLIENVDDIIRVNQDDQGRQDGLQIISKNISGNNVLLIDNCNLTVEKRKEYLDCLKLNQKAWAIVMETPIDECIYRAKQRPEHPTLKPSGAERVITEISKKYEPVTDKEGFEEIIYIKSPDDLNFILSTWKLPHIKTEYSMELMKFPRTKHLYNLGGASRDDLLLDSNEQNEFLTREIVIEEKIDGANFGISIDPETNELKFQNRSHYVDSNYAYQFKKLEKWKQIHMGELFDILVPGRHILFGEWVFAKHSIHYTNLPDYFVAFDIYDKLYNKFYSRQKLEEMLKNTTIPIINMIAKEVPKKMDTILKYIKSQSKYYNGLIEGVYLRICDGDYTIKRAKIVRPDFLCGNHDDNGNLVHWSKNQCTENIVITDE
jgi:predicted kinase